MIREDQEWRRWWDELRGKWGFWRRWMGTKGRYSCRAFYTCHGAIALPRQCRVWRALCQNPDIYWSLQNIYRQPTVDYMALSLFNCHSSSSRLIHSRVREQPDPFYVLDILISGKFQVIKDGKSKNIYLIRYQRKRRVEIKKCGQFNDTSASPNSSNSSL